MVYAFENITQDALDYETANCHFPDLVQDILKKEGNKKSRQNKDFPYTFRLFDEKNNVDIYYQ